jgi:hypothetical protein
MAEYQWTFKILGLRVGLLKYNLPKEFYNTWLYIYKADVFILRIGKFELYYE